jgi:hypothetical protein
MRKQTLTLAAVLAFSIVAATVSTHAQANGAASPLPTRFAILVHVPFSFQLTGRTFPAGDYRFEQVLGNREGFEVLVVRGLDRPSYQAVATRAQKTDEAGPISKIVFRRTGENLVLAAVCSYSKHAVLELYDAGSKQPMMMARAENDEDVVLAVPSEGELLAMARPAR